MVDKINLFLVVTLRNITDVKLYITKGMFIRFKEYRSEPKDLTIPTFLSYATYSNFGKDCVSMNGL